MIVVALSAVPSALVAWLMNPDQDAGLTDVIRALSIVLVADGIIWLTVVFLLLRQRIVIWPSARGPGWNDQGGEAT
jgi:hypothetical protein